MVQISKIVNIHFGGVKKCNLGDVKKFNKGDILWFITSRIGNKNKKPGIIVGLAEFTEFFDRNDEPLILINTYSNKEQNWTGDDDWSIQIHYENLYDTENKNIGISIVCGGNIIDYDSIINGSDKHTCPDLRLHYSNFKFYGELSTRFK
jgi:hypothetical protein